MSAHLYADPQQRKYATHTPAATWVSALYFYGDRSGSQATRELVAANLEKMANYHGIAAAVRGLREQLDADVAPADTALADSDFALIRKEGDVKSRHVRVTNAKEVKVAAEWFAQYRDEFTFPERVKIAEVLLEKAHQFGASLGDQVESLEKQACLGISTAADVVGLLTSRIHALGPVERPTELQLDLQKLAATVAANQDLAYKQAFVRQLAETVDTIDRAHKLHYRYDSYLQRPEEALFGVTVKMAAALEASLVATKTGNYYRREDLDVLDADTLQGVFGDAFTAHAVGGVFVDNEKLAAWVPQMSIEDAHTFDQASRRGRA